MWQGSPRLRRERQTLEVMVRCYCAGEHRSPNRLGADCQDLLAYAGERLARCPYGAAKPTCVRCPIHCYSVKAREQIQTVMRYAGPRMIWRHPILALRHWWDGRMPSS